MHPSVCGTITGGQGDQAFPILKYKMLLIWMANGTWRGKKPWGALCSAQCWATLRTRTGTHWLLILVYKEKKRKNQFKSPYSYMWFSLWSQTYRRMNKDVYFIFGYRQNWLNLPWDDSHIFYIFQWMTSALTTSKNSLKKTLETLSLARH
jgi:hypothetical protein